MCFRDLQKDPLVFFGLELAVYMEVLWRWGKEPAERSGLNNPGVNTGLGKYPIPPNQSIEGTG